MVGLLFLGEPKAGAGFRLMLSYTKLVTQRDFPCVNVPVALSLGYYDRVRLLRT